MASTEEPNSKIAPESQVSRDNRLSSFFHIDISLRILLFASCLTGIIVMVTNKQTKLVPVPTIPLVMIPRTAKFDQIPAFVYLVVALAVAGFYSIISILTSLAWHSNKLSFHFILLDSLLLGIVASATGAAGGVAYIGLKGNSHAGWGEVCNIYDKYCRYVGSSVAMSLIASITLVALVILSSKSLYLRSS